VNGVCGRVNITIIAVGRLKEKYLVEACQEYLKRLRPLAKVKIVELRDEPLLSPGTALEDQAKEVEASRILAAIPPNVVIFALDPHGLELSSEELASKLATYSVKGQSHFCFIIGGGAGLAQTVLDHSTEILSFSRLTFPHQLFRVMLLEQIYRALKINRNEPYHR